MNRASIMKQSVVKQFKIVRKSTEKVPDYNVMADKSHNLKMHTILAKKETKILNGISAYARAADYLVGKKNG